MIRGLILAAALLGLQLPCSAALADGLLPPPLVVLLRPQDAGHDVVEALVRLRGELVANGFDITIVERSGDVDPMRAIDDMGRRLSAAATIGFFATGEGGALELWVGDRLTGKTSIRRVLVADVERPRVAEVMAIRAVELLQSSFVEVVTQAELLPTAPPAPVRPPFTVTAATNLVVQGLGERNELRIGVEFGAVVMGSLGGIGPSVAPVLRLKLLVRDWLMVRLGGTGLGTRSRVEAPGGSAAVTQDELLVEVAARAWRGRRIRPQVSLGVGAYRLGVAGSADWPFTSLENWRWSPALDGGVGLAFSLAPRLEVAVEAHALFAQPYPVVRILDTQVASAGRPTLAAGLTLTGWL